VETPVNSIVATDRPASVHSMLLRAGDYLGADEAARDVACRAYGAKLSACSVLKGALSCGLQQQFGD
jgi:hypothetical protein